MDSAGQEGHHLCQKESESEPGTYRKHDVDRNIWCSCKVPLFLTGCLSLQEDHIHNQDLC
jgi:hypothetical protein